MRIHRKPLIAAMSLLLGAGVAFGGNANNESAAHSPATTSGFSWSPGRNALAAGSSVGLSWSLPAGNGGGFDEMELVLSLDGGRTFPIRVTRDLSPATRALSWSVPALPSSRARLALRVGDFGEPADEEILLLSEEFAIETGPVSRFEPTLFVRGEWRTLDALEDGQSAWLPDPDILEETGLAAVAAGRNARAAAPRRPRTAAAERFMLRTDVFGAAIRSERPVHHACLLHVPADTPRRE
jgi:hypothetical protein